MKRLEEIEVAENSTRYDFQEALSKYHLTVSPVSITTLWVNITRLCNQACVHCHVNASPNRKEQMNRATIDRCLELLAKNSSCKNLDITGGAPELNPDFDYFVVEARKLNKNVIVRHNITVIFDGNPQTGESKMYMPEFFAENQVEIVASLPHYTPQVTDKIRGYGVFQKSLEGIRLLNAQGYGKAGSRLTLNLVTNCDGPLSPSDHAGLEKEFKRELMHNYGLVFNKLFTVTNMPINRFQLQLRQRGIYHEYMRGLVSAFSP
ncbi:DUF3641 domain-containing protein, partial [Chloroflexota bacterium]